MNNPTIIDDQEINEFKEFEQLADIITEFCFETKYASKRIPVKTLTRKLKMLNV